MESTVVVEVALSAMRVKGDYALFNLVWKLIVLLSGIAERF